jgi:MFS family permease
LNAATRQLLRRHAPLRALVTSRLVSAAGTWLAYVALTVDVYTRTHSSAWVSAVLLASFLPTVAIAGLAGSLLDRVPRRSLLIGAELGGALVFVLLPFAPSAAAVVGLALLAGLASGIYLPTIRASLPSLVDEDELPQANALSQTVSMAGLAAGPVLAGALVATTGVGLPYLLNAASFVVSAALLTRLPSTAAAVGVERGESHWSSVAAGWRAFSSTPALATVLRLAALASLGGAAISVGEIFLAREAFHAGTFGFGLLASASGVGLVAGSIGAPRLLAALPPLGACRIALLAATAGFAGAALAPDVWVAAGCVVVGGAGNALLLSAATLLLQREVAGERLGRAFAILDAAGIVAAGIGMSAAGVLIAAVGARGAWLVAAGVMGGAVLSSLRQPKAARASQSVAELA